MEQDLASSRPLPLRAEHAPPAPGPEHEQLGVFVGTWRTRGRAFGPGGEGTELASDDVFEWMPGRFFVVMRFLARIDGAELQGLQILGWDPLARAHELHCFDSSGASGVVRLEREREGVWTGEGDLLIGGEHGRSRVAMVFSDGGDTIATRWERRRDDGSWRPLRDVRSTRVR